MTENLAEFFKASYNKESLSAPFPPGIVKEEALLFNQLCEEKRIERQKAVLDWVLAGGDPDPELDRVLAGGLDPEPISRRVARYLSYWGRRLRGSLRHQQD